MMKALKFYITNFRDGIEKARLERMSWRGPDIGGCGPEFLELVKKVYAPYNTLAERAKNISQPEDFFGRQLFRFAYCLEKLE